MASLLAFVKNKVQQVEHGVGQAVHDVTHNPVTNAVGNVEKAAVNTVAQAPQYLNPVNDVAAAGRFIGATTPHIPTFANTSPLRFANNAIINPVKTTGIHVSQVAQGHNPYHGSFGQQVGQAGQDALTLASALPIGRGAEIATKGVPLISKVAQGAKFGIKAGGGFGAAQGLSQSLQNKNNLKQTLKNVGVNAAIGAGAGGVLGAAAPAVGTAVTKVPKTPLDQAGKLRLPNLFAHNPANQDFHYTAPTNGYTKVSGKASDVISQLTKLNEVGAVGKDVNKPSIPTASELNMGKALDMTPKDVAAAKNTMGVLKSPNEFNPKVTKQLTQNVPKDLGATKNPLVGQVELPAAHDAGQAHLNAQFVAGHEQRVGAAAQTELAKLSPKDQNLMRGIQINGVQKLAPKAENPQQFIKTEGALRNYYNLRHAYDQSLGIPTPYRQNYLRDIVPKPEVPGTFEAKGGNLRPGYTQAKTQPGATPVAEGLAKDIAGSSFNHAKLTYAKGLEEAYPNQISRGSPIVGPGGVTQQLTTPYGNELFATKDLAGKINERGVSAPATGALGKYDNVNAFMKYVKLSGGAFHAFTEAGNFAGQQLMSGKLFTEPGSMGKVFKVFLSPKALDKEAANLRANGTFDKAELSGLTWTPKAIKADVSVTPHGAVAKYTGIKALHDATFQRELPYIKLKTFEQKTQGLDIHNPADLARMRSIAKGINSEIGGQNRLLEGSLTPKQARVTARFLLATDFTEGKVRTVLAALSKGGEEGKLAREVVAGKALVFAGLATAGGAASGNLQGKSPTQIAEIVLKNFADPSWTSGKNTVSLPATHVSEFTKPFMSFVDGSKDKFSGLKHYGSSRLAAVPSEITQLANNLDYTGNHIYGKNTKKNGGKPISGPQTAVNVAKGVLPIPVGQATSAVQGKQSIPATVGNIAGLRISPTPVKKTVTPTGNVGNRALTKRQKVATNGDELTRWQGMTAKARTNVQANNPDKYIRDQQLKVQQEQAQGKTTQAFKDTRDIAKTQITKAYDKNLVGAYGLNSTDFKAFIAQATPDQLSQLHNLDNQLLDKGLVAQSKFPKAKTSKSGSSRVASGRTKTSSRTTKSTKSGSKAFSIPKISAKKLTAPKGVKVKKVASSSLKTRKVSVSKIPKMPKIA